MKIKITKPDGTIVEAEGTAEECAVLSGLTSRPAIQFVPTPTFVPTPFHPQPWDIVPGPQWRTTTSDRITFAPDWTNVSDGSVSFTSGGAS